MRNLAKRVIFQTLNDKRSVALILIAPLLILTLVETRRPVGYGRQSVRVFRGQ